MKTTTKGITIATVLTFGLVSILLLTSFVAFKGRKLRNPEIREYLSEYFKDNVIPVLKEKRETFDQYLSNEEKQKVAELQGRVSVLHAERKDDFQQGMGYGNFNRWERPEISDEQKEQIKSHMKERRLIMTEAWTIADNHEVEIESIREDLSPSMDNWREDIRSMMEPYREERQKEREDWRENRDQRRNEFSGQGQRGGFGKGHGGRGMGMEMGMRGGRGQGMFMQYSSPPMFVLFDADRAHNLLEDIESRAATVFPNPTEGTATIKFELEQPETVNIKIYDNQGNLVSTVLDDKKDAGQHEIILDVSGYETGLYFYEIVSGSLSQKGRLVKR